MTQFELYTEDGLYTWFGESVICTCNHHMREHVIHFLFNNEEDRRRKDRKFNLGNCNNCSNCFKFRPQSIDFGKLDYKSFKTILLGDTS